MPEPENDVVVSGTVLTGDDTTDDLEGVIVTTVLNTPGVTRLVRPWWRRVGMSDDRSAVRISEEDGRTDVGIEVTVDLTVPIVRLTQDLRHRVATAMTQAGRTPGKVDVIVSRVERSGG
ncbi:hypothetical protein O6R08_01725 [Cutibacterium equinum]|uniref:Asp23/Gls24 family envelope stress response protein n=1 Tax=Cutibacterium equinum TaxID=3016342 RepID=A0ABY7QZ21_9ACTN|nr:hypothetical protein [Cutibacterium equinum]WCC80290.1 hypothetical protein O6R08_01725 [Cutibacterium equinum]